MIAEDVVYITADGLTLDRIRRRVLFASGAHIDLTTREFLLLDQLMMRKGSTISRAELMQAFGLAETSNVVDVYVNYLRNKLGEHWIETVRGEGYRFCAPIAS